MKPPDTLLAEHQHRYCAAIKQARRKGPEPFQAWFNRETSHSLDQVIKRGYWDFSCHILTPTVCKYIERPEEQVALEIGYGGGRLLNAACSYFHMAVGIDIHGEHDAAEAFLKSQGTHNFKLLQTTGATIDVPDESIDFIYSFIVLQHLPSFAVFASYLRETCRTLMPGGVAQLYFGNFSRLHPLYQGYYFWRGYREVANKPANHITLTVRVSRVRALCRTYGLKVVETGTSYYRTPDGYPHKPGGQRYVTLVKEHG
jgi:SAM-dependent methyltransferase